MFSCLLFINSSPILTSISILSSKEGIEDKGVLRIVSYILNYYMSYIYVSNYYYYDYASLVSDTSYISLSSSSSIGLYS